MIVLVGATLVVLRDAWAQTAPNAGARNIVKDRRAPTISDSDLRVVAASMDEGRAALKRSSFREAIQLFRKVIGYPENQYSAEAQELLGLSLQRNGQLKEAQAVYDDYVRRYPSGEASERVKQRLAGIVTAQNEASTPLRVPAAAPVGALPTGKFSPTHETTWTLVGGVSSFYIHDDAITTARDTSLAPNPPANVDDHSVHQNEILTTVDLLATSNNDKTSGKIRFSGAEEHRGFAHPNGPTGDQKDQIGVSQATLDMVIKEWNRRHVAGRQTYNGDGVFGRFDGAVFSWQALSIFKVEVVVG